jgi:hypothetical protein
MIELNGLIREQVLPPRWILTTMIMHELNSMTRRQPTSDGAELATLQEYSFQVSLVAVVRVRAADETLARKVVPSVLGSPGTAEIRLVNESNNSLGLKATVTVVDFFAKSESTVLLESKDKKIRRRR